MSFQTESGLATVACHNSYCIQHKAAVNPRLCCCAQSSTTDTRSCPLLLATRFLHHSYNYIQAGAALGFDGLNSPDLVAQDPVLAFKTAVWFWMTPQSPKPSCHDVMTGLYTPTAADVAAGRAIGYGEWCLLRTSQPLLPRPCSCVPAPPLLVPRHTAVCRQPLVRLCQHHGR